jgi:hypothetical protein
MSRKGTARSWDNKPSTTVNINNVSQKGKLIRLAVKTDAEKHNLTQNFDD